jgi:hypothetical protein
VAAGHAGRGAELISVQIDPLGIGEPDRGPIGPELPEDLPTDQPRVEIDPTRPPPRLGGEACPKIPPRRRTK